MVGMRLFTLLVLLCSHVGFSTYQNNNIQDSSVAADILPAFSTIDIFGKPVDSREYIGHYLLVEFIDPDKIEELQSVKDLFLEFGRIADFKTVVFIKKNKNIEKLFTPRDNILIIEADYSIYRNLFKVPPCCESFYLYDRSGTLILTTIYSYDIIRGLLIRELDNRVFRIADYIKAGSNINSVSWLKQIADQIQKRTHKYYLVALLRSICNSCPSGSIIRRINTSNNNITKSIIVLPQSYSRKDLENLKINMDIDCQSLLAEDVLENKWNQFTMDFNVMSTWFLIILIDNAGNIVSTADPNCNCIDAFFQQLNSLSGIKD
jgi:hypothetical protein